MKSNMESERPTLTVVLARSFVSYCNWCRDRGVNPHNSKPYIYIHSEYALRGLHNFNVIKLPGWHHNGAYDAEFNQYLKVLEATGKVVEIS